VDGRKVTLSFYSLPTKILIIGRHGGSHLQSQLLGRQRSGEWWFKASLGKKLSRLSSQPIELGVVVGMPVTLATEEV
jgi:hypothetical protein